jgi:hypothetical protein
VRTDFLSGSSKIKQLGNLVSPGTTRFIRIGALSMETDKILVLNIGPVEHLCPNLRQILERSTDLKVKVEQRSLLETRNGGFFCGEISNAIANFRPRVIFLVLAGRNSEQVNAALAFIRAESMEIPLFAVLEANARRK